MRKKAYVNQNYYDYAEMYDWDPYVVNQHVSKGWDPSSHDFQDNDDLFFNNWICEGEEDLGLGYADDKHFGVEEYDDNEEVTEADEQDYGDSADKQPATDNVILLEHHQSKRDFYLALSKIFSRGHDKSSFLKYLYDNTCQVCGHKIDLGNGDSYSETHHIQPRAEGGPDEFENMMVLCPNHHTLMDRGAMTVNVVTKQVIHRNPTNELNNIRLILKHTIGQRYINYHDLVKFN